MKKAKSSGSSKKKSGSGNKFIDNGTEYIKFVKKSPKKK